MGIAYKSLVFLYAIIVIISCFTPESASCKELVGVAPFTNQREIPSDQWLGYYLQARLQTYLGEGCNCSFLPMSTVSLWQKKANPAIPITIQNSILITGSFQIVLEQGIVEVFVRRFTPMNKRQEFQTSFGLDEIELKLDKLFLAIGEWIDPSFDHTRPFHFPRQSDPLAQVVFDFRQQLYQTDNIPDLASVLKLKTMITENSDQEYLADLAEGMILAGSQLPATEKTSLYNEAERLLRSAAMKYVKNSRLRGLLAEVFYLGGKESSWVLKTADESAKLDEYNSLAYLLQALSDNNKSDETKTIVRKINDVNPWIWPGESESNINNQFQKGIFRTELLSLKELLH